MNLDAMMLSAAMLAFVLAGWAVVGATSRRRAGVGLAVLALSTIYICVKLTCPASWLGDEPGAVVHQPTAATR